MEQQILNSACINGRYFLSSFHGKNAHEFRLKIAAGKERKLFRSSFTKLMQYKYLDKMFSQRNALLSTSIEEGDEL